MKKHKYLNLFSNKYTIIFFVLIVILATYYFASRTKNVPFETAVVITGNVVEKVSITGTISPISKSEISFKKAGVISIINVKIGDYVKRGDLIASIDNASEVAALASTQATLDDMTRSLNAVELAVQKTALDNAKQNALNAVRDGYAKTQGVLINYTDAFFNNPQSVNPTINIFTDSDTQKNKINLERVLVTEALEKWSSKISSIKAESVTLFIADIDQYLDITKTFVDNLSLIVGNLNTINSGLDRSAIDANIITINTGLSALNNAINIVTLAKTALFSAQSNYDLKLAGYSTQAISAQQARVSQARISVNDSHLVSPIDGIVTKASPNIGEFVSMGQSGFTVQSDNGYKIEAYVPEADVAKISIKNKAGVTLDSYGQYVIFPATVFYIDPAETIIEGVSTYKVTLQFDNSDNRIRSGMTANTEILTHEKNNVLVVSSRAVVDDGGKKTVRVVNKDGKTFTSVPVTIGLKGSYGTTEIISGLIDGQKVVTYIK